MARSPAELRFCAEHDDLVRRALDLDRVTAEAIRDIEDRKDVARVFRWKAAGMANGPVFPVPHDSLLNSSHSGQAAGQQHSYTADAYNASGAVNRSLHDVGYPMHRSLHDVGYTQPGSLTHGFHRHNQSFGSVDRSLLADSSISAIAAAHRTLPLALPSATATLKPRSVISASASPFPVHNSMPRTLLPSDAPSWLHNGEGSVEQSRLYDSEASFVSFGLTPSSTSTTWTHVPTISRNKSLPVSMSHSGARAERSWFPEQKRHGLRLVEGGALALPSATGALGAAAATIAHAHSSPDSYTTLSPRRSPSPARRRLFALEN